MSCEQAGVGGLKKGGTVGGRGLDNKKPPFREALQLLLYMWNYCCFGTLENTSHLSPTLRRVTFTSAFSRVT